MKHYSKKRANSKGMAYRKGFALKKAPLYSKEDFIYYFENRLNQIVRNEVEANFRECFYGLPF